LAFDRIEKQSIADRIFDSLRKEILDQTFQVGVKLPSEGALSEQFGVSKASVKIALQRLATLGLIETRVGQGSFVREFDPNIYLTQIQGFILNPGDVAQITEYRIFMEMAAVRLAVKKATPENYERMEEILKQMDETMRVSDLVQHSKLDYQFHLEICRATQNEIFILTHEIIGKLIRQHSEIARKKFLKDAKATQEGVEIHRRLLEAMKIKDLKACRQCYLEMFSIPNQLTKDILADA
jgi:GntR family transcriptional repressor for pyruvate dehydrogenase complex